MDRLMLNSGGEGDGVCALSERLVQVPTTEAAAAAGGGTSRRRVPFGTA